MVEKISDISLEAIQGQLLTVPKAISELELKLEDGRTELFELTSTGPVEFKIFEPVIHENGDTTINLEILQFEVSAESKVLWPGEKVTMSGGRSIGHEALPIKGTVYIPNGQKLIDGVESEQHVFIQVDCPLGTLHNVTAIPMVGKITGIPPIGVHFKTTNLETFLYDKDMNPVAAAAACGSTTVA